MIVGLQADLPNLSKEELQWFSYWKNRDPLFIVKLC